MDNKLKMSKHCSLAVMEDNFILGTLKKNIAADRTK